MARVHDTDVSHQGHTTQSWPRVHDTDVCTRHRCLLPGTHHTGMARVHESNTTQMLATRDTPHSHVPSTRVKHDTDVCHQGHTTQSWPRVHDTDVSHQGHTTQSWPEYTTQMLATRDTPHSHGPSTRHRCLSPGTHHTVMAPSTRHRCLSPGTHHTVMAQVHDTDICHQGHTTQSWPRVHDTDICHQGHTTQSWPKYTTQIFVTRDTPHGHGPEYTTQMLATRDTPHSHGPSTRHRCLSPGTHHTVMAQVHDTDICHQGHTTQSWPRVHDTDVSHQGHTTQSWPRVHDTDLTRFNKIAIPNNKFQMASGQGSHWLIESPTIFSSMCSPFITLCEKEYFLMSNLHCSLTNAALCPQVLLPSLSLKNIFLSTST